MPSRRSTIAIAASAAAMLTLSAAPVSAAPADHSGTALITLPPTAPPDVVGAAALVRTDNGLSARVDAQALSPGHVVTLWWVVFNDPDGCTAGIPGVTRCGEPDALAGNGDVGVFQGTGRLVGGEGKATFADHLRTGDTADLVTTHGEPLADPRGAEVILVLKDHGPKIPALTNEMLSTFAGGCLDQTGPPALIESFRGPAGPNACAEIQVAPFGRL